MKAWPFALCLLSVMSTTCSACTCMESTAAAELQRSSAVFAGTVLSVKHERPHETHDNGHLFAWEYIRHRIRIEKSWKGAPAGKVVTVYTSTGPCDTAFPKGSHVMVYASVDKSHEGALATSLCQ